MVKKSPPPAQAEPRTAEDYLKLAAAWEKTESDQRRGRGLYAPLFPAALILYRKGWTARRIAQHFHQLPEWQPHPFSALYAALARHLRKAK